MGLSIRISHARTLDAAARARGYAGSARRQHDPAPRGDTRRSPNRRSVTTMATPEHPAPGRPTQPGEHGDMDIISYGADGQEGGEGANADINNWE